MYYMEYMIQTCCSGMGDMIAHGILTPSGPFGHETGVMRVCGKDDIMVTYNQVKYCPFCGREIKVIQQ